ncbi:hypothetical protein ACJX0J_014337, partial [Zea mays]
MHMDIYPIEDNIWLLSVSTVLYWDANDFIYHHVSSSKTEDNWAEVQVAKLFHFLTCYQMHNISNNIE